MGNNRNVRFERNASQVIFDPDASIFVVTWAKCATDDAYRLSKTRDHLVWMPSVDAITTLYDRGRIPDGQIIFAAKSIGRAIDAGDRYMLDSEDAKKSAELVRDLASIWANSPSQVAIKDIRQAMRRLLDEIAKVKLDNIRIDDLDEYAVMPILDKAIKECFAIDKFISWPPQPMRKRFLYCLKRKERTPVIYTLISLLFDSGSCPLLSMQDSRGIRMYSINNSGIGNSFDAETVSNFFKYALREICNLKLNGKTGCNMSTRKQLTDSILCSSGIC